MKISSNEFSNCCTGFFVKHLFRKERLISHPDDDPRQLIGKRQYQVYCRILEKGHRWQIVTAGNPLKWNETNNRDDLRHVTGMKEQLCRNERTADNDQVARYSIWFKSSITPDVLRIRMYNCCSMAWIAEFWKAEWQRRQDGICKQLN